MTGGVTLVTGGDRGIGRAIVETLASEGRRVAFTWRTGEQAARRIEAERGETVRSWRLDLMDPDEPVALVRAVEESFGPVEGLVNNAGLSRDNLLAMTSDSDWDQILGVNLGGVFRCCRAVLPRMMHRRRGSIVNIASLSAFHGVAGQAAYAASKAGIIGLTRSLAREVGKRGVRVNAVVPGFVATDLTSSLPPEIVELLRSRECLPGGITPEAIARAVAFMLSDAASAVTGQALVVDAGSSA